MKYKCYYPFEKEMMNLIKEEWNKLHKQYPTIKKYAFVKKAISWDFNGDDDDISPMFTVTKYKDIPNSDFVEVDYYQIMIDLLAMVTLTFEGLPSTEEGSKDPRHIVHRCLRHEIRHIMQFEELAKWYNKNVIGILEEFYINLYEEDAVEFETKDIPIDVFLNKVNYNLLLRDADPNMART